MSDSIELLDSIALLARGWHWLALRWSKGIGTDWTYGHAHEGLVRLTDVSIHSELASGLVMVDLDHGIVVGQLREVAGSARHAN